MRQATREADDPSVPDWPAEHRCPHCGESYWIVETELGDSIKIDAKPLETELVTELYGEVRRVRASGHYNHPDAFHVAGWRLLDPVFVRGEDGGWFWFVGRARLTVELTAAVYSEHVYTCRNESSSRVKGLLCAALVTTVAPDVQARKDALRDQMRRWNELTRNGYAAKLPSELGDTATEPATQLGLFC